LADPARTSPAAPATVQTNPRVRIGHTLGALESAPNNLARSCDVSDLRKCVTLKCRQSDVGDVVVRSCSLQLRDAALEQLDCPSACGESPRAAGDHIPIILLFPLGDRYSKMRVSATACSEGASGSYPHERLLERLGAPG